MKGILSTNSSDRYYMANELYMSKSLGKLDKWRQKWGLDATILDSWKAHITEQWTKHCKQLSHLDSQWHQIDRESGQYTV